MTRTREELAAIILRGESVLLQDGRVITKIEDLPDAVTLAGNDIVKRQQAIGDLEKQAAELQRQIDLAKGLDLSRTDEPEPENTPPSEKTFAEKLAAEIGEEQAKVLSEAGYDSADKLKTATEEQVKAVQGLKVTTARKVAHLNAENFWG